MTNLQLHRIRQIKGFVNSTLANLPNTKQPTQEQAQYLIRAAMYHEKDKEVIEECNKFFKLHYNCEG